MYYDLLGDRFYFDGLLHLELIYLKVVANVPLEGRDLLYFLRESSQSNIVKENINEYCSCIDEILSEREKAVFPTPLGILQEYVPTWETLNAERKKDHQTGIFLKDGKVVKMDQENWYEAWQEVSCDGKLIEGILFKRCLNPVRFCEVFETSRDRLDKAGVGLWVIYSPDFYKTEILDKGLYVVAVYDTYRHTLWGYTLRREPDFTTITSSDQIQLRKGPVCEGIRYTGRVHIVDGEKFFEVDMLRYEPPRKKIMSNPFLMLVEEIGRDAENRLRKSHALPAIGEGWISEMQLYKLVKFVFPDAELHASPQWISPQHLDVFVPSQLLAFEYQGKQHYEPIDFFGGEGAFKDLKKRDKKKKRRCSINGVTLIEWRYNEPINSELLEAKLKDT